MKISVVIPAFNEAENIEPLLKRLLPILEKYEDYEVIFVDDGSQDNSLEILEKCHLENKKGEYVSFSRNFGHQYALRAGIEHASGDCVISMDADLQHPPELLPQMIEEWQKGYDVVYTVRKDTQDAGLFKKITSCLFYKIFSFFSGLRLPEGTADFRLLDKKVCDVLTHMQEGNLFLRGMVFWMGFKQKAIDYEAQKRFKGESSYTLRKMVALAVLGATSFSIKPLRVAIYLGLFIAMLGGLLTTYVLYQKLFGGSVITGWSSLMSVMLVLGGVQLFMMGIIGEYVGMIFMETKHRPKYIVQKTTIRK